MSKAVAVRSALLFISFHLLSAAVNCGSPLTRQQRVVCATPELVSLDQQLWTVYQRALRTASETERKKLDHDQAEWEVSSGGCWEQVDCIRKRFADRIDALQGVWRPRSQEAQAQTIAAPNRKGAEPAPRERARLAATQEQVGGGNPAQQNEIPLSNSRPETDTEAEHPHGRGIAQAEDQDGTLANAKQAANQELTWARGHLKQAPDYKQRILVAGAADRLAEALTWDNVEEIKAKTGALAVVNGNLNQFIQHNAAQDEDIQKASPTWGRAFIGLSIIVWVLLGLDWIYCLSQGLQNRAVLYFDWLDVFVSILGSMLLCASAASYSKADPMIVALLAVAGSVCSVITIRSSIKHNGTTHESDAQWPSLSFLFHSYGSRCYLGNYGRGADERKSSAERIRETFFGILIALLLLKVMKRLVNGQAVYALNASRKQGAASAA